MSHQISRPHAPGSKPNRSTSVSGHWWRLEIIGKGQTTAFSTILVPGIPTLNSNSIGNLPSLSSSPVTLLADLCMCLHPLIRLLHVNSHSEEQQIVIKKGRSEECEMKFVTYNVNGLRQRVSQHGSLLKLLNSLDADIICFQETKLQKYDLSVDVTMAEGYEAFFSCTRTSSKGRLGYSGVATFCRVSSAFSTREVALPIAAEEGLTGLLRQETVERGLFIENLLAVDGIEYMTKGDQLKVDSEGRCIITDHGHFVLFNLYGPRADGDDEERTHFKFLFYKLLERRWESLLAQGKRVIVVGDLNIAPSAIDRCDAEPEFEKNKFRAWLRSMLRESGGYFVDVFRSKHPSREGAYTCFSPHVGAEEFNYGSRIDHILIAGPCLHENHVSEKLNLFDCHVVESDIMIQFLRGNSVERPKWKGGRSIKLEGSDHVPVYMVLTGIPDLFVHNTPSLAVRYIPEVHGWQQTIVPFLKKRKLADTNLDITHPDILTTDYAAFKIGGKKSAASLNNSTFLKSNKLSVPTLFDQLSTQTLDHTVGNDICAESNKPIASDLETVRESSLHRINMSAKKVKRTACSQLTLRSFFHKPKLKSNCDAEKNTADESINLYCNGKKHDDHFCGIGFITFENSLPDNNSGASITSRNVNPQYQPDTCSSCSSGIKNRNIALLEWQRIQQKMKMSIPLCKGHGEPCVARSVKKKGPNIGRKFYICARAQGPAANSEANCGHFEWVTRRSQPKKNVSL